MTDERPPGVAVPAEPQPKPEAEPENETGWTASVRRRVEKTLPITELLPTKQPAYIGSWVYVFGVVTIAALFWVVLSGVVLAYFGSAWWHVSSVGHFFNSIHFWSVQMFFIFMVLHLWGQFWGAGWRDGRAKTWMVGVVIFAISVGTAFTGYVIQQNFDFAVDRHQCQGRDQLDRFRRTVQRTQLRPDVRTARDAVPDRGDPARGAAHHSGASQRRGSADRRSVSRWRRERGQGRQEDLLPRASAMMPYDLLKEVTIAMVGVLGVVLILSARAVLARRALR